MGSLGCIISFRGFGVQSKNLSLKKRKEGRREGMREEREKEERNKGREEREWKRENLYIDSKYLHSLKTVFKMKKSMQNRQGFAYCASP